MAKHATDAPAARKDSASVFSFPAVRSKEVIGAFDGGRLTSDGGVLVQAGRMMGICARLAEWPDSHITIRGDRHYGRSEVMAFCEAADVDCVFGLLTNAALRADSVIVTAADACAVGQAEY